MRASTDRQTALRLLNEEHNAVRRLIDTLSDEEMTRPDTIRHGLYADQQLSFQDLLAHLICYEAYAVETAQQWSQGQLHPIIERLSTPQGGMAVHYGGIEERRGQTLKETLTEWEQTQDHLMQLIETTEDEKWTTEAPFAPGWDYGGALEFILVQPPRPLYRHLPVHIPDTDAYIRRLRS